MDKNGFEIGVNIIVTLIIAIIIFVGGLSITFKFFGLAEERKARVDQETQASIESLLDTGAKVALPIFKKEVKRGSLVTFGLGIRNVNAPTDTFHVIMSFDEAQDRLGNRITSASRRYINQEWITKEVATETIANQERKLIPIAVRVKGSLCHTDDDPGCDSPTTMPGTYIFNVCVCNEKPDGSNPCRNPDDTLKACLLLDTGIGSGAPGTAGPDSPANGIDRSDLYGKTTQIGPQGDIHKLLVEVI